jgi:hypothetical protein
MNPMKEVSKTAASPAVEEQPAHVDDSTRQVLDEYSRRLLVFMQQEKEKVRKQAQEESDRIVADGRKRAQLVYDGLVRDATLEAETILSRSKEQSEQLGTEAQSVLDAIAELREKAQKEVDDLRGRLQLESTALAEAIRRTDKAIADSRTKMGTELQTTAASLSQLMQTLHSDEQFNELTDRLTATPPKNEPAKNAPAPPVTSEESPRKDGDKTFVGTINFEVEKGSGALFKRFKDALGKVNGLEISTADDYSKDRARLVAFASRPIILMNILRQMSLVKGISVEKGTVMVSLQDPDRWVG